jgi:DNA repair exonuclease SbcCD ATPase subunit/predicted phosphodiesterase
MTKIIHVADIHIRNTKYHFEYEDVFYQLFSLVQQEQPDFVVVAGDLAHTKTSLSPEYFAFAQTFYQELLGSFDGKIISIIGNHDFSLSNKQRLDAISPIISTFPGGLWERLIYLRESGEHDCGNIVFNALSILDEQHWITSPTKPHKINIALFHGPVKGSKTDGGWELDNEHYTTAMFEKFDYAMLGDIHKANQSLDDEGRIRYPGSLIQQNFGEDVEKGCLIWNIENKDKFSCDFVPFKNPRPFVTIDLDENKDFDESSLSEGCKIRLRSEHHQSYELDDIKADLRRRFRPSVLIQPKKKVERINESVIHSFNENLRDADVQSALIKEFLANDKVSEDLLNQILEINKETNGEIVDEEEVQRGTHWRLRSLEFNNLFRYGSKNSINFDNLHGIVGIFGKNRSGKSSIIDALLLTLFGTYSKPSRQLVNAINTRETNAVGKAVFDVLGGKQYIVERKLIKNGGKAKSELMFSTSEGERKEGDNRKETDKIIQRVIGSYDDFTSTAMASQFDFLNFINEGGTKRKKILARFLDLDIFDKKFKIAHAESKFLKQSLAKIKDVDYVAKIKEAKSALDVNRTSITCTADDLHEAEQNIKHWQSHILEAEREIASFNVIPFNTMQLKRDINKLSERYQSLNATIAEKQAELKKRKDGLKHVQTRINTAKMRYLGAKDKLVTIDQLTSQYQSNEDQLFFLRSKLKSGQDKISMLRKKPCGDQFPGCFFIQDASKVLNEYYQSTEEEIKRLEEDNERISDKIGNDDATEIRKFVTAYEDAVRKIEPSTHQIEMLGLRITNGITEAKACLDQKIELQNRLDDCLRNQEEMKVLGEKKGELVRLKAQLSEHEVEKKRLTSRLMDLKGNEGRVKQQISHLREEQKKRKEMRKRYAAYDLFKKCMHSNGIPFSIIKKKLDMLNQEIGSCISDIFDFKIYFEDEGKNLNIFLENEQGEKLLLDAMGSGSEKMIASMAIRLALTSISSLPQPDVFILDEPATALDADYLEEFSKMLLMLKNSFKSVILISHMDQLKDMCDQIVEIQSDSGYAKVVA